MSRLIGLRKQYGITQKMMAAYLEMSAPTYIAKEKNYEKFSIGEGKKAADLFGETIDSIFFNSEVPKKGIDIMKKLKSCS